MPLGVRLDDPILCRIDGKREALAGSIRAKTEYDWIRPGPEALAVSFTSLEDLKC